VVHDYAAKPSNSPVLHEFEMVEDLADLVNRSEIALAVVCCPWPDYGKVKLSSATKILPTWKI
jgi:UDPglucose 6-dehydrogenase